MPSHMGFVLLLKFARCDHAVELNLRLNKDFRRSRENRASNGRL